MDQRLEMLRGGCSAVGWQTEDGSALWARNMDFNRMAAGSAPTYLPKGTVMTAAEEVTAPAKYAAVGMGLLAVPGLPLLYDGMPRQEAWCLYGALVTAGGVDEALRAQMLRTATGLACHVQQLPSLPLDEE